MRQTLQTGGRFIGVLAALVSMLVAGAPHADGSGAQSTQADVRRMLRVLAAVGEEYREGVRDGTVVRPIELDEAKSFLEEAQLRWRDVATPAAGNATEVSALFDDVGAAINQKAAADAVATKLTELRQRIVAATGINEEVYPPEAPSVSRGQPLFDQYCATCHGERGDGKGPTARALQPAPASFTDAEFMRGETPYDFYHVISLGKRNTAMPAWDGALSLQERWDLVSYLWSLAPGGAGLAEGQGIYLTQCASCHGATGQGQGRFTGALLKTVPDLSRPESLARRTDAELFAAITDGVPGAPMPAFARSLDDDERWKAVAFVRLLSLGGAAAPTASGLDGGGANLSGETDFEAVLSESARLVDAAVSAYGRGERQAMGLASDAYLQFEPLEPRLGAHDPGLKAQIEERFLHLRQQLRTAGNDAAVRSLASTIDADLRAARSALQPKASPYALFIESATIILREGLEIVLVIGALIAYVVRTGNVAMQRSIYAGTALGVAASLATAFVMGEVLQSHPGSSDVLEGITMLLAAVVLFWVSYWLISKAEADKWQRYIRGKVQNALTGRRSLALAGAAFLAVYREGFETVLFYQALYASAPTASVTVTAGFFAGALALLIVYGVFRRFEVQIPIRQFFFVTGLLLYALAAIFAGQGVHELQEAGVITMTPVTGIPALPLLGVYPSVQSLAVQAVFVALLVYATVVTLRRRRATTDGQREEVIAELHALRTAIDSLREEIHTIPRSQPGVPPAGFEARIEKVLVRVEEAAGRVKLKASVNGRANGGGGRHGQ